MQRILRGAAATLRTTKLNGDGEPTAPTGSPTVTVTRWDGTTVTVGTPVIDGNDLTATIASAETASLDLLTAEWTDSTATWTSTHEVVGGYLFSVTEARASDKTLEDEGKYRDSDILARRSEVEQEFEKITGQSFVPRFATEVLPSRGSVVLEYPNLRKVRSISIDGTAYTSAQIDDLTTDVVGVITGLRRGRATIAYEHGLDRPPPDLKRAALTRLRQRLNFERSSIPDRALSWSTTEGGTYRLSTPAANRTGEPDVDACLERYSVRTPGVA